MGRVLSALEARLGPVDHKGNIGAVCEAIEESLAENSEAIARIEKTLELLISVIGIDKEISTLRTLVAEFKQIEDPDQIAGALVNMADITQGMRTKIMLVAKRGK